MTKKKLFFIIGAGRSGTTALTKILDTADNALVSIEEQPKFCIAARDKYHNILPYPREFIAKTVLSKLNRHATDIYGDKNPNYMFFVEELFLEFQCKFVFMYRDGRDVVRSVMNFNRFRAANYHRYEDDVDSTLTQPEDDFWDYARLRPLPGNPHFDMWRSYSRFEKFCWLWANFNTLLLRQARKVPSEYARFLDMTHAGVDDIETVFNFLELHPFKKEMVKKMLKDKINTVHPGTEEGFPHWSHWDESALETFDKHARDVMIELGYYSK